MSKAVKILGLLFSFLAFAGSVYADSTPPDPIIDTEIGSGSYAFFGTVQLQINWGDLNPTVNCHAVGENQAGVVDDCTGANNGFITQVHVISDGVDQGLQADTLLNESNQIITNLDFLLSQSQGPFSPTSPFSAPSGAVFNQVTNISEVEAIYGLNPQFAPGICPAPIEGGTPQCSDEVSIGFKDILINENGSLGITLSSNVPTSAPEPSEAALLLSALPIVWIARRKLVRRTA